MKRRTAIIAAAALAFASCQKPADTTGIERTDEAPAPVPASAATPTPQPVAVATPAVIPAPAPETAPPGRWFLRRKLSVENADGIVGLPPGTALDFVSPGQYRTLAGQPVAAADADVTNVVAEVRALVNRDAAVQAAVARSLATPAAPAVTSGPPVATSAQSVRMPAAPAPRPVAGVETQSSGLQTSTALGAGHSKTDDGVLWQKSADGKEWVAVKWLKGGTSSLPRNRPVK